VCKPNKTVFRTIILTYATQLHCSFYNLFESFIQWELHETYTKRQSSLLLREHLHSPNEQRQKHISRSNIRFYTQTTAQLLSNSARYPASRLATQAPSVFYEPTASLPQPLSWRHAEDQKR